MLRIEALQRSVADLQAENELLLQCVQEISVKASGAQAEQRLLRVRGRAPARRPAPPRAGRPDAATPAVHCSAGGARARAAAAGHASEWHVAKRCVCPSL